MVFGENDGGLAFWKADGWIDRTDLRFMQKPTVGAESSGCRKTC
jgi:hypothetical protein